MRQSEGVSVPKASDGCSILNPRTPEHLSQIDTNWTQLGLVRDGTVDSSVVEEARRQLLHRYAASVYQYLLACVRDESTADDLAQDFALRFLDGRYESADRDRGRFRDFLKRCLSNMATDYFRSVSSEKKHLNNLHSNSAARTAEKDFDSHWQQDMLAQTWTVFEEKYSSQSPLFLVLRHRAEFPDQTAVQISAALQSQISEPNPLTDAWVRQTLHRGRAAFAKLLRNEVARTLTDPNPDSVDEELGALGLLKYCSP